LPFNTGAWRTTTALFVLGSDVAPVGGPDWHKAPALLWLCEESAACALGSELETHMANPTNTKPDPCFNPFIISLSLKPAALV
jgi:hypothetical protein